jgi:hypothetical protein
LSTLLKHVQRASNIVADLKLLYNTQQVIASGDYNAVLEPEPVFVDLLRSPGIDSQPGGIDSLDSILGILKRFTNSGSEDSSSRETRKRATSAALHSMIDRHLARKTNKLEHTWFKKRSHLSIMED